MPRVHLLPLRGVVSQLSRALLEELQETKRPPPRVVKLWPHTLVLRDVLLIAAFLWDALLGKYAVLVALWPNVRQLPDRLLLHGLWLAVLPVVTVLELLTFGLEVERLLELALVQVPVPVLVVLLPPLGNAIQPFLNQYSGFGPLHLSLTPA